MNWFSAAKRYYDYGFYTKDDVKKFVLYGKITEAQYTEITGDVYVPAVV